MSWLGNSGDMRQFIASMELGAPATPFEGITGTGYYGTPGANFGVPDTGGGFLDNTLSWMGNHPLTTARMFTNLMDIPGKLRKKGAYEDLADQLTGFRNEYLRDYNRAVENASWNDTKRTEYMKGIMGTISSNLEGTKRRLSANQAALGRGGGGYGKLVQDAMQKGREQAATARAETYKPQWFAPANTSSYDSSIAQALAAANSQGDVYSSTAGDLATSLLSGLLSDKILSGLGSIFG